MSLLQKIFTLLIVIALTTVHLWAADVSQLEETIREYKVNIPDKIYVEDTLEIDITNL
jgi:hypothetical protein